MIPMSSIWGFCSSKLRELTIQTIWTADCVYRYGGEEFCIIMPESGEVATEITVRIGGAGYPKQSKDTTGLIKCADKALYQAKEMGKDRFILSSETP